MDLKGDFRDAEINMRDNLMNRFDESIFKPFLKQMDFATGYIDATKSIQKYDKRYNIFRLQKEFLIFPNDQEPYSANRSLNV